MASIETITIILTIIFLIIIGIISLLYSLDIYPFNSNGYINPMTGKISKGNGLKDAYKKDLENNCGNFCDMIPYDPVAKTIYTNFNKS